MQPDEISRTLNTFYHHTEFGPYSVYVWRLTGQVNVYNGLKLHPAHDDSDCVIIQDAVKLWYNTSIDIPLRDFLHKSLGQLI